ncbi:MAG: Eco57I restriction-modification methylase domain-containing protein, partial [Candidatus Cloacimonetes bacterium]|nr:Eco57I restriction-modification methylase domain-containing protein [Candidatus Cloacimonadota bacterium]
MLTEHKHNPDVLSCIANLSSDEVFTPPELVNQMLDLLPASLFSDKNSTWLDPACKSGVFLREIAKRLDKGLETQIPDLQTRINHIFTKQLFGLPITELTALLSRRSLYCSKKANGEYSVCTAFKNDEGNIRYNRIEHTWEKGRCVFCGANEANYDRSEALESHAYSFIHTENPEELFKMKFDVIIGNPPYQMGDGGFGKSATPIYNKFVEQSIKLNPRYLSMIIPARWFAGGKGLDEFRNKMLNDVRMSYVMDYEDSSDVFPGVSVAGGICYFLWEKDHQGLCKIVNKHGEQESESIRALNEYKTFIRHGQAIPIIRKVLSTNETRMNDQVSAYKPFGLRTFVTPQTTGNIKLYWQKGIGPYNRNDISVGTEMIDKWKVICSRSGSEHAGNPGSDGKRRVLARTDILPPGTICTETYLVVGCYET